MNNPNNIDNYFKKHLENLEADTSNKRWRRLYWMLIYKRVLIWALFIGIAGVISFLIINPLQDNSDMVLPNEPISISSKDITPIETSTSIKNENELTSTVNQNNSDKPNKTIVNGANTGKQSKKPEEINPNGQKKYTKSIYHEDENLQLPKGNIESLSILESLTAIQFNSFKSFESNHYNISTYRNVADSIFDEGEESENIPKAKTTLWSVGLFLNPAYNTTNTN